MPFLEISNSLLFIYMDLVASTVRGWLSLRLEVTLQKKLWSSKAMYNKRKPPTVPFSGCRDPNSSVSHKVPWLYRPDLLRHPTTIPKRTHRCGAIYISNIPQAFQSLQTPLITRPKRIFLFFWEEVKSCSLLETTINTQRIFLPHLIN